MVELLAPAGNYEKLVMALHYGADAVYAGGTNFSLRERSGNFDPKELEKAVNYTHKLGKKIYIAANIYAHNNDIDQLPAYIKSLGEMGVDAIILSDPGVLSLVKEFAPKTEIHLSTQANTTNYMSANFWKEQGISRIVMARELSLPEIKTTVEKSTVEVEMFVHGAQCMAYSGRCLISNYLTDRDANQGDCAQSCRWNYELVEQKRPDDFHPVEEDSRGTYFFNSKDLSLIQHLPDIIESGVTSLKIEGRVKSIHYTATIVRAYREAIDLYYRVNSKHHQKTPYNSNLNSSDLNTNKNSNVNLNVNLNVDSNLDSNMNSNIDSNMNLNSSDLNKNYSDTIATELTKVSHRAYSTGFLLGNPGSEGQSYDSARPEKGMSFLGKIIRTEGQKAWIDIRGKFSRGDSIEIMRRRLDKDFLFSVTDIYNEDEELIEFTKPNSVAIVHFDKEVSANDIIRIYNIAPAKSLAKR